MSLPTTDTLTLVADCIRRKPAAQKELVRRYAALLLSVARRYARNQAEAEDILQDSFLLIFDKMSTYQPEKGNLQNWMCKIVIHKALAHYRKYQFHFETTTDVLPDNQKTQSEVFPKMGFDEICALIQQLPEGMRQVFNLAVFDEYSHDEIAALLHIPAGTARSLLSRARKLLQEKITQLYAHELAGI